MRVAFDTNVLLYAVGGDSPYREPCRRLVDMTAGGRLVAECSVELVQEYLHVRARRTGDRSLAVSEARGLLDLLVVHSVEPDDAARAVDLFHAHPRLDARDAVHAASCLARGVEAIVSADAAFDDVPGLRRLDPVDAPALLGDPNAG